MNQPPIIGAKKIKVNIALQPHGELNVLDNVTAKESAQIGVLSALVILQAVGNLPGPLDFDAFLEEHKLHKHFTAYQVKEETPTQDNKPEQNKIH